MLVGEDDASTGATGGQRGGEAGRPGADDEQVAMRPALLIGVRIGLVGGAAETRRLADEGLVELFPEGGRPHEGLVVEAGARGRARAGC